MLQRKVNTREDEARVVERKDARERLRVRLDTDEDEHCRARNRLALLPVWHLDGDRLELAVAAHSFDFHVGQHLDVGRRSDAINEVLRHHLLELGRPHDDRDLSTIT